MAVIEFQCNNCDKKGALASIKYDAPLPRGYVKLLACSRCKEALYCNKDCQTKHWSWHKGACANWVKQTQEYHAKGELTIHERTVNAAKSGYRHTLTTNKKIYQLIEGINRINTLVGTVYESEEECEDDEMFPGVCLHVDGQYCAILLGSKKRTTVDLVTKKGGKESTNSLPRFQMKVLSPGDKILLNYTSALLQSRTDVIEYKMEN